MILKKALALTCLTGLFLSLAVASPAKDWFHGKIVAFDAEEGKIVLKGKDSDELVTCHFNSTSQFVRRQHMSLEEFPLDRVGNFKGVLSRETETMKLRSAVSQLGLKEKHAGIHKDGKWDKITGTLRRQDDGLFVQVKEKMYHLEPEEKLYVVVEYSGNPDILKVGRDCYGTHKSVDGDMFAITIKVEVLQQKE